MRRHIKRTWFVVACEVMLMALLAGCASVTITPVTKEDRLTPGVRFYESEPYLLVTKEVSKAGVPTQTIQIVWLPNYNLGYAVKTTPGLGTADGSMTIVNGWQLTVLGANVDAKVPETINAVTNLIKTLGVAALTSKTKEKQDNVVCEPGLYRLKFNKEKGSFEGLERVF